MGAKEWGVGTGCSPFHGRGVGRPTWPTVANARPPLEAGHGWQRARAGLDPTMFTRHNSVNMAIRHKHLKLDQTKIDKARRLLDVSTEQETVDRALDLVIAEDAILRAHRKVKGVGGMVDVFGDR